MQTSKASYSLLKTESILKGCSGSNTDIIKLSTRYIIPVCSPDTESTWRVPECEKASVTDCSFHRRSRLAGAEHIAKAFSLRPLLRKRFRTFSFVFRVYVFTRFHSTQRADGKKGITVNKSTCKYLPVRQILPVIKFTRGYGAWISAKPPESVTAWLYSAGNWAVAEVGQYLCRRPATNLPSNSCFYQSSHFKKRFWTVSFTAACRKTESVIA